MDFYSYKGISAGKYIEGEIEALNQEEASHKLKSEKVIITNLVKLKKKKVQKKDKKKGGGFSFGKPKVKPADIVIFSKQFATMVKAGLPILNVLVMLRDQVENPSLIILT
jgi:type IV pilus assembly protein PilC